jgi:hypothetical protein
MSIRRLSIKLQLPVFTEMTTRLKPTSIVDFGPLIVEQLDPDVGGTDVDALRRQWRGSLIFEGRDRTRSASLPRFRLVVEAYSPSLR